VKSLFNLKRLSSIIGGALTGLIVALGFQVLPDVCCDDTPMVFDFNEFLATVMIILLAVSMFGFLHYAARKFLKLGFMLRFKSVVAVGILTALIPVFGITMGASGSEPLWHFCVAGIIGGAVWSLPFAIRDSKLT
tara:strand:- start:239 stop:643 length:405 start_codon:yes stop_codon:yes gene_type:complete